MKMKIGSLVLWRGDDDIKNGYGIVFKVDKVDKIDYHIYWIDIKVALTTSSDLYIEIIK